MKFALIALLGLTSGIKLNLRQPDTTGGTADANYDPADTAGPYNATNSTDGGTADFYMDPACEADQSKCDCDEWGCYEKWDPTAYAAEYAAEAIKKCDQNGDGKLSWKEVKKCVFGEFKGYARDELDRIKPMFKKHAGDDKLADADEIAAGVLEDMNGSSAAAPYEGDDATAGPPTEDGDPTTAGP